MTSTENYPGEPGLGFVEETSGSEAEERGPWETRPDRVTASAGDRQIGAGRLQPDVAASFALVDAVADEPLAFDRRLVFGRFDLVESQTFTISRPKADQARRERVEWRRRAPTEAVSKSPRNSSPE